MKTLAFVIAALTPLSALAYEALPSLKTRGSVSYDCAGHKESSCAALRIIRARTPVGPINVPSGGGNPAWGICRNLGGVPETRVDTARNEISVCTFADHSLFLTWEYIQANKKGP